MGVSDCIYVSWNEIVLAMLLCSLNTILGTIDEGVATFAEIDFHGRDLR